MDDRVASDERDATGAELARCHVAGPSGEQVRPTDEQVRPGGEQVRPSGEQVRRPVDGTVNAEDGGFTRRSRGSKVRCDGGTPGPRTPVAIDGPDGFEQVIASYPLVIAEFHAEWCGPCQLLAPILESIAGDPEAVVATVDVDANSEIVFARRVRSVPLVELYHTGERVERLVGSRFEQELREVIRTDRTG